MYQVPYFKSASPEEIAGFMQAHPFILLCGTGRNGYPVATHIPVLIEERAGKQVLLGHIMRKQDHTVAFEENSRVLAVFQSPHSYVSASWYTRKDTASTWNYQAVHARGRLTFLDEGSLYRLLVTLTDHFEKDPSSPSRVPAMEEEYVRNLMQAIVGIEIEIEALEHVFKLSQNRDAESYENIIRHLQDLDAGSSYIADQMQQHRGNVFPVDREGSTRNRGSQDQAEPRDTAAGGPETR